MYFSLNEYTYLVSGAKKSAVYDFANRRLFTLDDESSKLLLMSEKGEPIDEYYDKNSIFKDLEAANLGFTSEKRYYIDKVRLYNSSLAKRADLNNPKIESAYIRLNNRCMANCSDCNHIFCPICFLNKDDKDEEIEYHTWENIIDKLIKVGLKNIYFTGGDPLLYNDLDKLVEYCLSKNLEISIITSGTSKVPPSIPKDVQLILIALEDRDYKEIINNISNFKNIVVKCKNDLVYEKINSLGYDEITVEKSNLNEIKVDINNLVDFDLGTFYLQKNFDSCLYSKIYIDHQGNVVPCFNDMNSVVGNMVIDNTPSVLRDLIDNHWYKHGDADNLCSYCELTYACPACKYINPEKSCKYNPLQGIWKE